MALGVCLKAFNAIYFKRNLEFLFEFIPQIVLLMVLFGFMDMLIIVKWQTDFDALVGSSPPSIISSMISMFLNFGKPENGG